MYFKYLARLSGGLLVAGVLAGVAPAATSAATTPTLDGAGSTLVAPLEAKWAAVYESTHTISINYNSDGSGKGEAAIAAGSVDFGASDAPLSSYTSTPCSGCYQIPWALSATGVGFHVGNLTHLHLTGKVIAEIYMGDITNWDNNAIKKLNKGTHLPNLPITVFWRNDASGDTYAFTDYESKVSSAFRSKIGNSTTVNWPVGDGEHGNLNMATALAATNGGIAYVAVSYLASDWPRAAAIQNQAGRWEVPNLNNISNAASSVKSVPSSNQLDITNPPKRYRSAYPISTFTYAIAPGNAKQGSLLRGFIGYAISKQGQQLGYQLDFVPIPKVVYNADSATLNKIQ